MNRTKIAPDGGFEGSNHRGEIDAKSYNPTSSIVANFAARNKQNTLCRAFVGL